MKLFGKMLMALVIVGTLVVPMSADAGWANMGWRKAGDTIKVNGETWKTGVKSGADICALVLAAHYDTCDYGWYDWWEQTHHVTAQEYDNVPADQISQDRLIVKNPKNEVIADFMVPAGTDHRTAVAEKLGVDRNKVEWLSGDTQPNPAAGYGYEAILLVRH